MTVKRRMEYGAIALIWIVMPIYLTTISFVGSDIVDGRCMPWGAYSSNTAEKAMISSVFIITYLLPLIIMIFCYSRIVFAVRTKVTKFLV